MYCNALGIVSTLLLLRNKGNLVEMYLVLSIELKKFHIILVRKGIECQTDVKVVSKCILTNGGSLSP